MLYEVITFEEFGMFFRAVVSPAILVLNTFVYIGTGFQVYNPFYATYGEDNKNSWMWDAGALGKGIDEMFVKPKRNNFV